jgi:hypothetical protein
MKTKERPEVPTMHAAEPNEGTGVAPETTPEQKAALQKAFDTGAAEAKAGDEKTRPCPECGIPNPINRITCEICGARVDAYKQPTKKGGGTMDEIKKELFESNKRLRNARAAGDTKLESNMIRRIKSEVKKSKGMFEVGPDGLAIQVKSTKADKPKAPPRVKKEKPTHICPDCGEVTNGGSYFKMGHDGRTHGILIKLSLDKIKKNEVKSGVIKLYDVWIKSGKKLSMKECAQKVAGE